ncbi:AbrB/MazE/SpoVT family DNA-binding domain-containing protein [Eilatimonas milleporae]|uniref:Putative addiction module antidote n=1 Tax=Eilatimonas milleporae TaxID=911205 RepID=A0A3M0CRZ7_9PROT|nr:AbrB/MazE/SpoVT family DNA-binding domain-containing protein [Eilatimonas milleporae]RMB12292.1 putative addiction module antidote [Eilatimonas milleporae]
MHVLKLTSIGTSTGAIFPKDLLARLKLEKGDRVYAVETPDGILLTPYDPTIQDQLDTGRDFMKTYRDTFKVLAK